MYNPDSPAILSIADLHVKFTLRGQTLHALRGICLDVYQGESLAIVGESGSGKSVLVKTVMGLLDANGSVTGGSVCYDGRELTQYKTDRDWMQIRGKEIAMVFQDPMTSLNPLKTIGAQVREAVERHQGLKGEAAYRAVLEALADVGIDDPERRYRQYPHEFSGGMRQRVVIAMALVSEPNLLLADEPTTALDVTIQAQILTLMKNLQEKLGTSMIFITHDLGIIAEFCENVAVVYGGEVIERGSVEQVFTRKANHPYTDSLFNCIPDLTSDVERLTPIPGFVLDMRTVPTGCPFAERCTKCTPRCKQEKPAIHTVEDGHYIKCHLFENEVSK